MTYGLKLKLLEEGEQIQRPLAWEQSGVVGRGGLAEGDAGWRRATAGGFLEPSFGRWVLIHENSYSASLGVLTLLKSKRRKENVFQLHAFSDFSFMSLSNQKNLWLRNRVPQTSPLPCSGRKKTYFLSQVFNISAVGANVQADEISSPRGAEDSNLRPHSWFKSQRSFIQKHSKKVHLLWNWPRKLGPCQSPSRKALWSVAADIFISTGK